MVHNWCWAGRGYKNWGGGKDWSCFWGWPRENLLKACNIPVSCFLTQSSLPTPPLLHCLRAWNTLHVGRVRMADFCVQKVELAYGFQLLLAEWLGSRYLSVSFSSFAKWTLWKINKIIHLGMNLNMCQMLKIRKHWWVKLKPKNNAETYCSHELEELASPRCQFPWIFCGFNVILIKPSKDFLKKQINKLILKIHMENKISKIARKILIKTFQCFETWEVSPVLGVLWLC